jgi:hypothetical protein
VWTGSEHPNELVGVMSTYGGEPVLRSKAIVDEEESGRRRRKEESIALENIRGFNGFYTIQDGVIQRV